VNATSTDQINPSSSGGAVPGRIDARLTELRSHARFAIGAGSLPFNVAVEVAAVFEVG
jgi:hypothetical protein